MVHYYTAKIGYFVRSAKLEVAYIAAAGKKRKGHPLNASVGFAKAHPIAVAGVLCTNK